MYQFLHTLLSDKKGGAIFTLFSGWHFFYILLTAVAVTLTLLLVRSKGADLKKRVPRLFINTAFGLYIADIFLMPPAYGEIDVEKLPFHACTAMCVACFLSYLIPRLERYRSSLVLLGLISNLVYLVYPAGVMWHAVHPTSYRVVQTLLFHSVMTAYGILFLVLERESLREQSPGKYLPRDLAVTVSMTLWALLGNYTYNHADAFYNWFFVVRDPFYVIPESISPFVMPPLVVALFFSVQALLRLILSLTRRAHKNQ